MIMDQLKKVTIFDRGYFLGHGLHQSLKALELALKHHTGTRKHGGPEVEHQIEIANLLIELLHGQVDLKRIDHVVASAFLHDLIEDYPEAYSFDDLRKNFSPEVYEVVKLVTKPPHFDKHDDEAQQKYYREIVKNPDAVLVKASDRIHNLQTISGLKFKRQREYARETEEYFLPMLKWARKRYTDIYFVYVVLANIVKRQLAFIQHNHILQHQINFIEGWVDE